MELMKFTGFITLFVSAAVFVQPLRAADQTPLPAPAQASPDAVNERFVELFTPFRTDKAALSPDGKYLAYTWRENGILSVIVVEVDNPSKATAKATVISDDQATSMMAIASREKTPAQINWMHWVTPNRLVLETNRNFPFNLDVANSQDSESAWLNCTGEIVAFDANGQNARSLATPKDLAEWSPSIQSRSIPRTLHIVDYCPDDSNSVLLQVDGIPRTGDLRYTERYKLNIFTGKLTSQSTYTVSTDTAYLFDRSGAPRVSIPESTRVAFPHLFMTDPGSLLKRGKSLDQIANFSPTAGFSLSPQNYFGERAIPLGFGLDPNVLYFASNIGRNTYGIYGLDVKTGKRTAFVAESPLYDLFSPAPGIFPDTNSGSLFTRDGPDFIEDEQTDSSDTSTTTSSNSQTQQTGSDTAPAESSATTASSSLNTPVEASVYRLLSKIERTPPIIGEVNEMPLVYSRYTHDVIGLRYEGETRTISWLDHDIKTIQTYIEQQFPGRTVDIQEWDSQLHRFLIRIRGTVDSGAFYVFDREKHQLTEFVQRAPWLNREKLHKTVHYSFPDSTGRLISGTYTFPHTSREMPVPVVVLCPNNPWDRVHADFQPELEALAEMGFAVVQVNTRGAWGFGIKYREAIKPNYEEGQIEDIVNAISFLAKHTAINPKRVALLGKQHGGFLALRALQLQPAKFRCAIVIGGILDTESWIADTRWTNGDSGPQLVSSYLGTPERIKQSPLLLHPEKIAKPVLFLHYRGEAGQPETLSYVKARTLSRALKSNDVPIELYDLSEAYISNLPKAKAEVYHHIEDFLNAYIYNYSVKFGTLKQMDD